MINQKQTFSASTKNAFCSSSSSPGSCCQYRRLIHVLLLVSWILIGPTSLVVSLLPCPLAAETQTATSTQEGECQTNTDNSEDQVRSCVNTQQNDNKSNDKEGDEKEEAADYYCGLYLAESSIPNSGWGMFAGAKGYRAGDAFPPDVAIVVTDMPEKLDRGPKWKLWDYVWDPYWSCCDFHADRDRVSRMVLPGLGSLANSHTRLINVKVWEPSVEQFPIPRSSASAGAFAQCQNHQFQATRNIAPGHEVFAKYGDIWFAIRYPDVPRFTDFEAVDDVLAEWRQLIVQLNQPDITNNDTSVQDDSILSSDWAGRIWKALASTSKHMNERIHAIMPRAHDDAIAAALHPDGLAGATATHRSVEWLEEHGMCLDHLQVKPSEHVPSQNGAFVKRPFRKGERISPVPVIPLYRNHMHIERGRLQQQHPSQQLLLNYCYGHPESSLMLYPYGPLVNLINHGSNSDSNKQANVALRWSPLNNSTHLHQSVMEILTTATTRIVLELYALRDLRPGEEVLLDYGTSFEMAWQRHQHEWNISPPIHSQDYQPPHNFTMMRRGEEGEGSGGNATVRVRHPPSHIRPRCWIDLQGAKRLGADEEGWYPFVELSGVVMSMRVTTPCEIQRSDLSTIPSETESIDTYNVIAYENDQNHNHGVRVKNVPSNAISFVDKPYQGHQFLRQAFRHEIHLSDTIFPESWKDLAVVPPQCNLYMAETTVPNSTEMGLYTVQPIAKGDHIAFGDVVVPVVNFQHNNRLRRLYHQMKNVMAGRPWFLNSYRHEIWQLALSGNEDLSAFTPGLGMLANSHRHASALVNAKVEKPSQMTTLHRAHDPGAGASSYYHNAYSTATKFIQAGEELVFAHIGDKEVSKTTSTETQQLAAAENGLRTAEWLNTNGRCLDNIRPGDSTILQAGKGAFATRRISLGSVIAPMPMVPILRGDLDLFESLESAEDGVGEIRRVGQQLLLNYCYGHPSSSLLLLPYSPVVNYVNHNSSPNAKLVWSKSSTHHNEWVNRSPADLAGSPTAAGLMMELVALREIQPNEEVFIDYGERWIASWQAFERSWQAPQGEVAYAPAWVLNKRTEWLRTEKELEVDPYPYSNVRTACYVGHSPTLVDDSVAPRIYKWTYNDAIFEDMDYLLRCDVLDRNVGNADLTEVMDRRESIAPLEVYYKVRVHYKENDVDAETVTNTSIIIAAVPREAIRFIDTEDTSDLFLRNAFRHEIQLADELIPESWRDLE